MTQNHEQFTAVWLDSKYADCDQTSCDRRAQLSPIINYNVKFSDADECLDYIKTIQTESIVFITCGSQGQKLVPNIYHFPQLLYIYIYCFNKVEHEEWALNKNYASKIRGVFTDIDLLLAKINDDVKLSLKNILPLNIFHKYDDLNLKEMSMKDLNKQSAQFMWFQLLIDTLLHGDYSDTAKDDMFYECVAQYDGNEIELKRILDFYKTYIAEQAISWYTRNSFLYRLLNKAFRIQNINIIYKFRYFIKHLYNQLRDVQLQQSKDLSSITVYRGQLMHHDEFDNFKENVGELISINTFFSTTLQSQVALNFTGNGFGRPDYESVLFEIHVDCCSLSAKPFGNVQHLSFIKDEYEMLFCVGTIFRIKSVEDNEPIWHVVLELSNDENIELKGLVEHFSKYVVETKPTLLALADVLTEMGEYEKARHFSELFLSDLEPLTQNQLAGVIQSNIGLLDYHEGHYEKAMQKYETGVSMQLLQQTVELPSNEHGGRRHNLGLLYNNIGIIYIHNAKYDEALNFFEKALDHIFDNHIDITNVFSNIAVLHCYKCEYQLALEYSEKALTLEQDTFPKNHPQLASAHLKIGGIHHQMGNYDLALKSYQIADEIYRIALSPDHPSLAITHANIGMIYIDKGDFKSAIEITRKSLTTLGISENHPIRGIMHSNLGLAYLRCCDYTLAMENFEKALQIQFVSLPADHLNIATTYNNIATIYFESEENYERALENYEKALEIQLRCLPSKADSEIALTYNNIGSIYYRLENYSLALENYKKSVEIMTKCLPENHFDFSIAYNNIGLIYAANGNYTEALINYNKALSTSTSDHPFSSRTYLNIGDVYRMTDNSHLALENYEKSLEIQMQCSTQNNHDLLRIYNVMTVVYSDMNNREMSLKYYEKFLEILLIIEPLNFNEHSTAYENIADLLFLKDDFKAALEYYNKAIEAAEKTTTPSPETIEKMQKMIRVISVKLASPSNELKDGQAN
ncbi:unnamed protein product [Rotaria socialis]